MRRRETNSRTDLDRMLCSMFLVQLGGSAVTLPWQAHVNLINPASKVTSRFFNLSPEPELPRPGQYAPVKS